MAPDKYSAVWVSHSSMGDFLKCPRAYYLHNVYKNPKTGKKINIVSPALSLGSVVHEVLEGLAEYKVEERFKASLIEKYEKAWVKISGRKGGFTSLEEEAEYRKRGREMIERVEKNPGPLLNKTVKMKEGHNGMPPNFFLSDEDNIILCGKIDWLEYIPADDSVRVLDFKTGKHDEKEDSLQLPIYALLLNELQKRTVSGAGYWYIDRDDTPIEMKMPDIAQAKEKVLTIARQVKGAREKKEFKCPRGEKGCFACQPFEKILRGEADFLGNGEYGQEMYLVS